MGVAEGEPGALCCALEPADGVSRLIPVPCALAKPVPAISAAAATEIIKRLIIERSPRVSALPASTTKGDGPCSAQFAVPWILFFEREMNAPFYKLRKQKAGETAGLQP